jgi:hypothetical protein
MFKALNTIFSIFLYKYSIRNMIFVLTMFMCKFFTSFDNHTALLEHDRNTMCIVHVQKFVLF